MLLDEAAASAGSGRSDTLHLGVHMPTLRERASTTLLRIGTDNSIDRAEITRSLERVPSTTPGYQMATGAMACARWVDELVLWVSWRLRPRRMTGL